MEAKKKENRSVHWGLYIVYRFYNSSFFLFGQIVLVPLFILYAFVAPFVLVNGVQEILFAQDSVVTEARIVGEPVATACCKDYYDYRLVFQLRDGSQFEVIYTSTISFIEKQRDGDMLWIYYAESNPGSFRMGYIEDMIDNWVSAFWLVISVLLFTGYFVIGAILIKIYYPKPKIKVTEADDKPKVIEG